MKTITVKEKSIQSFLAENQSEFGSSNNQFGSIGQVPDGRFRSSYVNLPHEIYIKKEGQIKISDVVKFIQTDYAENTRKPVEIESIYIACEYDDISIVLKKQNNQP